ncbi:fumarate reductase subunit FrdD [Dongshaea marina]|uniref:fumarate reductase subunit FrdD n=1 Tax=Dongshaea marina TaxID=2047966 RepID=UPI000D3E9EC1|nr:fumarate reductase subunit FrdD [Dongshaea marina]
MRRSDEPIYWGLFGAGGVVCAMLLPALILVTGILIPLGVLDPGKMDYAHVHAFVTSWYGFIITLVVIIFPIWHAMHRIYHGLHDLGVRTTRLHHYLCYGFAFFVSAATFVLLIQMCGS